MLSTWPIWIGCSLCKHEVGGSTPTGGTCPNDFSDPIDQDIGTQCALRWKIVVSEWQLVIAVSVASALSNRQNCTCARKNTTNITRPDARGQLCTAIVLYR